MSRKVYSRLLLRRIQRPFPRFADEEKEGLKHVKHGPRKWRDYKSPYVDPPFWYKWSLKSPYSPEEQVRIRKRQDILWYKHNYAKRNYTPPDEWLYHVGDRVEILAGKDKGKQGDVIQIVPEANFVVVGGFNKTNEVYNGQMHGIEEPLEHHEVSLVDPKDNKATEITWKADENGDAVRVSVRTGHIIPKPPELLHDRTQKMEYISQEKDTKETDALSRTFVPTMKHYEDELKELYKVHDPPKLKTFWY